MVNSQAGQRGKGKGGQCHRLTLFRCVVGDRVSADGVNEIVSPSTTAIKKSAQVSLSNDTPAFGWRAWRTRVLAP